MKLAAVTSRLHKACRTTPDESKEHFAINTTTRCQHRCVYCFEGDRAGNRHLETEEVRRLIRDGAKRVPAVIFMGAETTLRRDFVELVAFAKRCGLRVGVSTNGLRFADMDFLRKSVEAGLKTIELSFPYPDAEVYSELAGVPPGGYSRLLQALDNINALPDRHRPFLEVGTVISKYNYRRLDEVMRTLMARVPGLGIVILKRVISRETDGNPCAVPLSELRSVLPSLLSGWEFRFPVAFRDFPLCAAPGFEHLNADLADVRAGGLRRQNFFGQKKMVEMYADEVLFKRHKFSAICARCSLRSCCLMRSLFLEMGSDPANVPVPSARPAREVLLANGAESQDVVPVLKALRSRLARCSRAQGDSSAIRTRARGFRRLLAHVDREMSRVVKCRSRYDGDVIRVSLGGAEYGLFLAPRETFQGSCFAELPSFSVCIRGEVEMPRAEAKLLKVYARLLARRDGEIKAALQGALPAGKKRSSV